MTKILTHPWYPAVRRATSGFSPICRTRDVGRNAVLVGMRYAGEDSDARPLPHSPLSEFKRRCAANAPFGSGPVPDALYFAFYADRYRVPPEDAITVPADHLWWLASEQDTVLLSDRVTHHYTTWPGRPRARTHRLPIQLARRLLSPRRPQHIGHRGRRPERVQGRVPARDCRAGHVEHAPARAALLQRLPRQRGEQRCALALWPGPARCRSRSAGAGGCHPVPPGDAVRRTEAGAGDGSGAARRPTSRRPAGAAQPSRRKTRRVRSRPGNAQGRSRAPRTRCDRGGAVASRATRLGNAAGKAREFNGALRVLDRAIDKDATFEDAIGWSKARIQTGDAAAAAADALQAIRLNDGGLARLQAERAAIDPRGRWELSWKDRQIGGRRERRESELSTLLLARTGLGDFKGLGRRRRR